MAQANDARRENRLDEARAGFEEAAFISRREGNTGELARALMGLAQIERDRGKQDAALPYYREAVALARETNNMLLLAHASRHLGDLYRATGELDLAAPCYEEALDIYRGDPDTGNTELANALRPMALLLEMRARPAAAREYWEQAKTLYASAGIDAGVAECTDGINRCS